MFKSKRRQLSRKTRKNKMHKKMKGGAYTTVQVNQLIDSGFTSEFVKLASRNNIGFNVLWNEWINSGKTAQQYMQDTYNDLDMNPDLDGMTSGEEDSDQEGGRKRRKKTRKNRKYKKGGDLYGNGYGANCYDPNYSIYNTNLLKLFPYSTK